MTEADLRSAVCELADRHKLLWHWCADARRCCGPRGLPDLIIAGRRGLIIAELKTEDGETSAPQDLWLWTLGRGTHPGPGEACEPYQVHVWRPAQLRDGTIGRVLEAIA